MTIKELKKYYKKWQVKEMLKSFESLPKVKKDVLPMPPRENKRKKKL